MEIYNVVEIRRDSMIGCQCTRSVLFSGGKEECIAFETRQRAKYKNSAFVDSYIEKNEDEEEKSIPDYSEHKTWLVRIAGDKCRFMEFYSTTADDAKQQAEDKGHEVVCVIDSSNTTWKDLRRDIYEELIEVGKTTHCHNDPINQAETIEYEGEIYSREIYCLRYGYNWQSTASGNKYFYMSELGNKLVVIPQRRRQKKWEK